MNEELEQIARDMRKKERELWAGNPPRMGNGAVALMLDGYASRLEVALGLAPRPRGTAAPVYYTPNAALDVIAVERPLDKSAPEMAAGDRPLDAVMTNPPFAEEKPLYAENLRKAGIRSGCFAYLFAALIVCALLAAIPLLMVFLGWLTGGAK